MSQNKLTRKTQNILEKIDSVGMGDFCKSCDPWVVAWKVTFLDVSQPFGGSRAPDNKMVGKQHLLRSQNNCST